MKNKIILLLMFILTMYSCSKVPAGNVGVKVYLLGKSKGVDTEELGVGRYWIGINEELYLFPTFQQNYVWTKNPAESSPNDESFTFQTIEGMQVNADVGISYHLNPTKVNTIFQKYRKGIEEITDIYMRNYVRDGFNTIACKYAVSSVYGAGKAKLIEEVHKMISEALEPQGIIVDKLYWIGALRLPEKVLNALNAKIEATQKAQQIENEIRSAEAEAKKKIAIARGEAEANRIRLSSITRQMIDYERMLNERKALEKWNGQLPTTMIPESTLPLIGTMNK